MHSNSHLNINAISGNATTQVSANSGDGRMFHIYGIHNAHSNNATVTWPNNPDLSTLTIKAGAHLSFNAPLTCYSFTPSHSGVSVFYHQTR